MGHQGQNIFKYSNKYYYSDLGLRNAIYYRRFDFGQITENNIYNELISRGYSVDVGVVSGRRNSKMIKSK